MHAVPSSTVATSDVVRPDSPCGLAAELAARPEWWRPLVAYHAGTRWYRLITRTDQLEVWLLSWLPGQGTDLHDHGQASGAFATAAGTLTERVLTTKPGEPPVEISRTLATGRSRAFGPHHIHQVTNLGTVPAVSVHVYTPALTVMNRYRLEPQGLLHLAADQVGADW